MSPDQGVNTVAAIGAGHAIEGFALAGASVMIAESDDAVRASWQALPPDVGLVILTSDADRALQSQRSERPRTLTVVMP